MGDQLMILFWREILPQHPGATALVEVKCSQALVDEIKRLGGRPEFTRTGHSLIKARMREIGAVFTGEMSGHMFFADEYYGYDDCPLRRRPPAPPPLPYQPALISLLADAPPLLQHRRNPHPPLSRCPQVPGGRRSAPPS